jgi:MSHA biogenesis protein MshE
VRLVRLNCESCAQPHQPDPQDLSWLEVEFGVPLSNVSFKRGRGCSHCNSIGLAGRTGIYEMLEITPELTHALNRNETNEFAALAARDMHGRSLKHQALELAAAS